MGGVRGREGGRGRGKGEGEGEGGGGRRLLSDLSICSGDSHSI